MIFLWVLLLHIPRALMEANHANETAGVFEALALSGVALLVASAQASRPEGRD
jgi:predicted oxidoreductase